ncbi:MAG: hypothetical protein WB586_25815 [Chthoniobacterales bacterium]
MYFGLVRLLKWVTGPLEFVGQHPAIFLCLPSVYLLLFYPILWKDIDAVAQLVWPAGAANILHYPPLYCFLGRIPFWIGDAASAALMGQPIPTLNLFAAQSPSLTGIYALIICQHLAFVAALVFLAKCCSSSVLGTGIVTLCFLLASSLYAQQQCAGSESLSVTAILFTVAFGLRTLEKPRLRYWIGFTVAFFTAIGTRHINVILGASLPLAFIGIGGWLLWHRQPEWRRQLLRAGVAALCVVIAFSANVALARAMIAAVGDEYRPSMGVTLSDRVATFLNRLPASEKRELADKLASAQPNPIVRVAIHAQLEKGSYSLGADQVIRDALLANGVPKVRIQAESERVIFAASLAYLKTLHPRLLSLIWRDFSNGFIRATNGKLSRTVFISNQGGARLRLQQPELFLAVDSLPSLDYRRATLELERSRHDYYLGLGGRVPLVVLFVVVLALGIVSAKVDPRPAVWLAQTLVLSSIVLFLANCVCVYYMDRYTLPLMVCGKAALAIQIGGLADSAQNPKLNCRAAGSAAESSEIGFRTRLRSTQKT